MTHADRVAVICSAHVNAVGIALSLREAGWADRVVALSINGGSHLAARWGRLCEFRQVTLDEPEDLVAFLRDTYGPADELPVFFTDERFLPAFALPSVRASLPNARFHVGTASHLEVVLDRELSRESPHLNEPLLWRLRGDRSVRDQFQSAAWRLRIPADEILIAAFERFG